MIVLSCTNITKAYVVDNVIENISFSINEGEKIGLVGLNGTGKTTLFNILTNTLDYDEGNIYIAKGKKLGYLKQNTRIESTNTIIDEMMDIFSPIIKLEQDIRALEKKISSFTEDTDTELLNTYMDEYSNLNEKFEEMNGYGYKSLIRGVLKGLGFNEDEFDKPINLLSGGQKSRVMLAKLLLMKPDILLLDEPTNHLDIDSKEVLEDSLTNYDGTILVISHDRYFLNKVVNKIFDMSSSGLFEYLGNYDYYLEKKAELEETDNEETFIKTKTQLKAERKKEREILREKRKKDKLIKDIETLINENECNLAKLENIMCLQETYNDKQRVFEIQTKINNIRNHLDELYEKWTELHE